MGDRAPAWVRPSGVAWIVSTRLAHTRVADRREDRAIYHLAHGDLRAALHLDALAVLCLPLLLWWFVAWTGERLTGRPLPRWDRGPRAALVVGIVTVVWLVVRNLPWVPFTALRV